MSDSMSFAEIGAQYAELLPARTVLSGGGGGPDFHGDAYAGDGGAGGNGGIGVNALNINLLGDQSNSAANGGAGGYGGSAVGNLLSSD